MMRIFVYEHLSGNSSALADAELLAAGVSMRDAVVEDLVRAGDCAVSVAAGPHAALVPGGARAVRPAPGTTAVEFVARQAALHDRVWVIAPETGGVLAQLCHAVNAVGAGRWLGCDQGTIALASSKRATLLRAADRGLLTPLAFAALPSTRRWVVKPDDGAGALDTRVHHTLAAARDDAEARDEPSTLEAWVAGEPLSVSLLCGPGPAELLSVNRQQIAVDDIGRVSFTGVQIDAVPQDDARTGALRDWARALAGHIGGLHGYVGVDLVWHPQRGPVLIEINPRVTMAYVGLSAALGRNLASAVLMAHDSEQVHAPV